MNTVGKIKSVAQPLFQRAGLGGLYVKLLKAAYECRIFVDRLWLRRRYSCIIRRIRRYEQGRKIKVLFWVTETAKWKAQSLYDAMARSSDFDPCVVLGVARDDLTFYGGRIREKLANDERFYKSLGCRTVTNFDFAAGQTRPLSEFHPDMVFFQDPRQVFPGDEVRNAAHTALCCYIPYAIKIVGEIRYYLATDEFHQLMFLQFLQTPDQCRRYAKSLRWWHWAGKFAPVGHPILDQYAQNTSPGLPYEERYVIYAPHFSFPTKKFQRPITLSSFLSNGVEILEYAKKHPEFKWMFKPHPNLRRALMQDGDWSEAKVNAYYDEWAKIGRVCVEGDYIRHFKNARAMITDCGSFLAEFPATGAPLIRLVPKELDFPVFPMFEKLFSTFYTVHDLDGMYKVFHSVLENGEDPLKNQRMAAYKEIHLMEDDSSAARIMRVLDKVVLGR